MKCLWWLFGCWDLGNGSLGVIAGTWVVVTAHLYETSWHKVTHFPFIWLIFGLTEILLLIFLFYYCTVKQCKQQRWWDVVFTAIFKMNKQHYTVFKCFFCEVEFIAALWNVTQLLSWWLSLWRCWQHWSTGINMSVNSFTKSLTHTHTLTDLCFVWWNVDVSTTAGTLRSRLGFGVTVYSDTGQLITAH